MLSLEFDDSKRVAAPAEAVWQEIFPLSHLLRLVPEADDVQVFAEDRRAVTQVYFTFGSIKRNVVSEAKIDVAEAPSLLRWSATIPSMRLEFVGEIEIEGKDADRAILRYDAELACENRFLNRLMKGTLMAMLEDHVDHVLQGAADAATKHFEAARRLSKAGGEER